MTVASVGRQLGCETSLQKHPDRFPLTTAYLQRAVELQYRWERRRLRRIALEFVENRTMPSPHALRKRATLAKSAGRRLQLLAKAEGEMIRRRIESDL